MSSNSSGRLAFLDYMRAFAFLSVLIGHKFFPDMIGVINDPTNHITVRLLLELFVPLCVGGAAGVVVFFLTSGYIITHVLQSETPTDFVIKRIFRIYPLYIFAVVAEMLTAHYVDETPFPPLAVLIPRLMLIGDFFDIPNALAGVEWTLRIEILFYLFMASTKTLGAFSRQTTLPLVYMAIAIVLYASPAFPSIGHWNAAYVNSYSLFLLLGSTIYLIEKRYANVGICIAASATCLILFLIKIAEVQPGWKDSHYAVIALAIFLSALYLGPKLKDSRALRLTSDLTFSIYLFHNWLWDYILLPASKTGLQGLPLKLLVVAVLFVACYAFHLTVERAGLKLGRIVLNKMKSAGRSGRTTPAQKQRAQSLTAYSDAPIPTAVAAGD